MNKLKKIVVTTSLLQLLILSATQTIKANTIIAQENFEDGLDDGWIKEHESGSVDYSSKWKILNGMYGLKINSLFIVENSFFGKNEWTDYQVEFDMLPISGLDKNFIFRYQDRTSLNTYNRWYEIHISGTDIHLSKHGHGDIVPAKSININNGTLYNWRIKAINTRITIEYKKSSEENYQTIFDIEDSTYDPILNGKIGIRIGTGVFPSTEIYFDNIVVTDLNNELIDISHQSQKDPQWADQVYDHATEWAEAGSTGIKNWGCALTSASMILSHHGFQTNPAELNQYLIDQSGYTNWGGVIWSYFTKFARDKKQQNPDLSQTKLLEFSYPDYDSAIVAQDLSAGLPVILKLLTNPENNSHHFLVAAGTNKQTNNLLGFDPAKTDPSHINIDEQYPSAEKLNIARFTPSNTDLSYLWIFGSNTLSNFHINNNPTTPFQEGSIQDSLSSDVSQSYQTIAIPKPQTDNYLISFTTTHPGFHTFEVAAFDSTGDDYHQTLSIFVTPEISRHLNLYYNHDQIDPTNLKLTSSTQIIRSMMNYGLSQQKMSKWAHKHFLQMLDQVEKQMLKNNHKATQAIIAATISQISESVNRGQIDQQFANQLIAEFKLL